MGIDIYGLHDYGVGSEWGVIFPDGGNPLTPAPQTEKKPKVPPTPTADGCPQGWKMVPNPQFPPKANGCGPAQSPPLLTILLAGLQMTVGQAKLIFHQACNDHDLCWGECEISRAECDEAFGKDLKAACNREYPFGTKRHTDCLVMASLFSGFVKKTGKGSYEKAVKKHCKCVCDSEEDE